MYHTTTTLLALLGFFYLTFVAGHGIAPPMKEETSSAVMRVRPHYDTNSTASSGLEYPAPFWVTVNNTSPQLLTSRQDAGDPASGHPSLDSHFDPCNWAHTIRCETTAGSPLVEDVIQGSNWFRHFDLKFRCWQRNKSVVGSHCTTMDLGKDQHKLTEPFSVRGNWAKFSLCDWDLAIRPMRQIPCQNVAYFADRLIEHCTANGRAGGRVFIGAQQACEIRGLDLRISKSEKAAPGP